MELAGITFDLIIIRIWRGLTTEQSPTFVKPSERERRACRRDAQSEDPGERSGAVSPIVVSLNTVTISVRDKDDEP